jgi:hypothetical protein
MGFYDELVALVQRTRNDPQLFHRLVYEPETVLDEIGFLSQDAKRQILGLSPAELTAKLLGCQVPSATGQGNLDGTVCEACTECTNETYENTCGDCTLDSWGQAPTTQAADAGGAPDATPTGRSFEAFQL